MSTIQLEFEKTAVRLLRSSPFYAHILMMVRREFTENKNQCPTACVTFETPPRLIINQDYFLTQNEKVREGILEHEILHLIFRHNRQRFRDDNYKSEHNLLNIAWDLVVNQQLEPEKIGEKWQTIQRYGFPPDQTSDWYFQELLKIKDLIDQQIQQFLQEGGLNGIEGFGCSHSVGQGVDETENKIILRGMIAEAYRKAKSDPRIGVGKLPGKIKEYIETLIAPPKIHWSKEIRSFNANLGKGNLKITNKRESKRFGTVPGTRIQGSVHALVVYDTSGSISIEDHQIFSNEIKHLSRSGASIEIAEVDTEVHRYYPYKGKIPDVVGGGGTNLMAIFDYIKRHKKRVESLIFLTDGFTELADQPPLPLKILWVIKNNPGFACNWGRIVHIN